MEDVLHHQNNVDHYINVLKINLDVEMVLVDLIKICVLKLEIHVQNQIHIVVQLELVLLIKVNVHFLMVVQLIIHKDVIKLVNVLKHYNNVNNCIIKLFFQIHVLY